MLVRRGVGIYEEETLQVQGIDSYILKSRKSRITTPTMVSEFTSIKGTRLSSTDKKP
ncbi:Uncharacterised protein [Serratia liquefaciens]|nr:Uncharacterised protein [Serratia liquefaciens]